MEFEEFSYQSHSENPDLKERAELLEMAIESLPEKYREVIVLKEFLGFSYQEIADLLGVTLPSVRINIYRAKQKIKEILTPYLEDYHE